MPHLMVLTLAAATVLAAAGAASAAPTPFPAEAATIRALRLANNRAIANRDLDAVMAIAADDYVLAAGNDGLYRSKAEMTQTWRSNFADANNHGCVRTPDAVEVGLSEGVLRAAETGHWTCVSVAPDGGHRRSGKYLAHWSKRSGDWRVVSDNYVTLRCAWRGCEGK